MDEGNSPVADDRSILNAQEAARLLRAHVETLRRLARKGEIPAFKVGKDWRFQRDALMHWAETHHLRQRQPHVLAIDDEEAILRFIRRSLEPEGCRVHTASEGEEALGYVSQHTPDLVLLDLKMPGMNGVEFLRRFREDHADVPVMVVTGYPDSDLMHEALRYGPLTLLAKPVQRSQLVRFVRIALRGSLEFP